MKKTYATLGPVPFNLIAETVTQIEAGGWTVRFVSFSGTLTVTSLASPKPVTLPAYAIISCVEHDEKETPKFPEIKIPGVSTRT